MGVWVAVGVSLVGRQLGLGFGVGLLVLWWCKAFDRLALGVIAPNIALNPCRPLRSSVR